MAYKPFVKLTNDEMVELPLCAEKLGTVTVGSTSEPIYLDAGSPKKCTALKSMIVDLIYPVGSYFITESSSFNTTTKVANHFGGTWTRVEGRFLYGSNSAGGTGGSNDAKVISHNHTFEGNSTYYQFGDVAYGTISSSNKNVSIVDGTDSYGKGGTYSTRMKDTGFTVTPSGTISTEGSSGTNANMPAYRTVYMYRRTA